MEWSRTPLPEDIAAILTTAAHTPPQRAVTVDTIQSMTYATQLIRTHGARGESTPIDWHRKLPILATTWDSDWWSSAGDRLACFSDRASGTWSADGLRFLVRDFSPAPTARLYDFATRQLFHLTMPPDTDLLLNPRLPLLLLGSSTALMAWQIGTQKMYPFQDAKRRAPWRESWAWSPDGTILTQAAPIVGGPGSVSDLTHLEFWTYDGQLLAAHTHPLPSPGTWHWRLDSRIVISCHGMQLCWWDRAGTLRKTHTLTDRGVGSYHADQYVAWRSDGQMAAALGGREAVLFDADGGLLTTTPLTLPWGASCLDWHPSGSMLSVGDWSSTIHTFAVDGTLLHSLPTWERPSSCRVPFIMRWSTDGSCLAVSSRDCSIFLYTITPADSR
jgi:WD40 repeat protein